MTCPACGSYVEFYVKNLPRDPKKPITGKCAKCGQYFPLEEDDTETESKGAV